jgi:predicted transcriptional regulator of viral defense system
MKRNMITENELQLLEDAIVTYGVVVSFSQLQGLFNKEIRYTRKRISKLVDDGWLTRIKKGLYVISDISTRGSLAIDHRAVVNLLVEDAYISFLSALQFHGYYNQLLSSIRAVSVEQTKSRTIDHVTFHFTTTQKKYFYGWETHEIDGQVVKIASFEKALIDLIQFHRSGYSTDIVLEKLLDFQGDIDQDKLFQYLLKSNLTTRRIFGFMFDCAGMDSQQLLQSVANRKSVSSMSDAQDKVYNHKWRLYTNQHFEQTVKKENDQTKT